MSEAFDERYGQWHFRISKARLVWFALAQEQPFTTTATEDPFAHYGAARNYRFALGETADEVRAALRDEIEIAN